MAEAAWEEPSWRFGGTPGAALALEAGPLLQNEHTNPSSHGSACARAKGAGGAHPHVGCGTSTGGSQACCRTTQLIKHLPSRFLQTISEVQPLQPLLQHISSDLKRGELLQHRQAGAGPRPLRGSVPAMRPHSHGRQESGAAAARARGFLAAAGVSFLLSAKQQGVF